MLRNEIYCLALNEKGQLGPLIAATSTFEGIYHPDRTVNLAAIQILGIDRRCTESLRRRNDGSVPIRNLIFQADLGCRLNQRPIDRHKRERAQCPNKLEGFFRRDRLLKFPSD